MQLIERNENSVIVLELSGRLDSRTTPDMETKVVDILKNENLKLLIDFSDVDYINSSGLRVLVMAYQRMKGNGGALALCGIKDYILEVFEISGYDRLFKLFPDQTSALSTLG